MKIQGIQKLLLTCCTENILVEWTKQGRGGASGRTDPGNHRPNGRCQPEKGAKSRRQVRSEERREGKSVERGGSSTGKREKEENSSGTKQREAERKRY